MDKELLNKEEIQERINTIKTWINKGENVEMIGTARNEVIYYQDLLSDLEDSIYPTIKNDCPTQIFQQIGVLL